VAYNKAHNWHLELKATGFIQNETGKNLMIFDDGYYWIDLETNSDKDEADAMGHCGTTNYGDTLYSLRKKQSPHVTTAVKKGTVFQMKGRKNERPIEKYHKYIFELLSYPNVSEGVKIINGFDKIINFSTTEWEPGKDFHVSDLSIDLIVKLKERNPELINNLGLPVKYKLYKGGHFTKEELIKGFEDLKIIDDKIHFVIEDWLSFEKGAFLSDRGHIDGWQLEVLEGTYLERLDYDLEFDFTYNYDKIEPRGFEEIINVCTKKKYEISYDDESFIMSKENMSLSPNKDDIWIKTPIGGVIPFKDLLQDGGYKAKTSRGEISFYTDDLSEMKDQFDHGYCMAQALADESEAWNKVIEAIKYDVGDVIKSPKGENWWFDEKGKSSIHFNLNWDYIFGILDSLEESDNYHSIIDIINSARDAYDNSGDKNYIIDVDVPYYGWNGTIDSSILTEEIIDKLSDL